MNPGLDATSPKETSESQMDLSQFLWGHLPRAPFDLLRFTTLSCNYLFPWLDCELLLGGTSCDSSLGSGIGNRMSGWGT